MKEYQYPFEKLLVFQKSREVVVIIYDMSKYFPVEERYGLTSQIRRASLSIMSNIAEGASRVNKRDQARFTEIAYSSATEVLEHVWNFLPKAKIGAFFVSFCLFEGA